MSRVKKGAAILAAMVALIGGYEGLRTVAYRDVVGIPTVCFGETRGVEMGDSYTVEQCKTMLGEGIIEFSAGVDRCLTTYVPDKSYTAFVSLAYNIGTGAFCRSTVVRKANAGDLVGACNAITMWDRAGGKQIRGLVIRRADEQRLCLEGVASR